MEAVVTFEDSRNRIALRVLEDADLRRLTLHLDLSGARLGDRDSPAVMIFNLLMECLQQQG